MHVELEEPPDGRETTSGEHDTESPEDGVVDSERVTLPVKPPRLVRAIVEDAFMPDWKPRVPGLAATE